MCIPLPEQFPVMDMIELAVILSSFKHVITDCLLIVYKSTTT